MQYNHLQLKIETLAASKRCEQDILTRGKQPGFSVYLQWRVALQFRLRANLRGGSTQFSPLISNFGCFAPWFAVRLS